MNASAKILTAVLLMAGMASGTRAEHRPRSPLPPRAPDPGPALACALIPAENADEWTFPQESRDPGYVLYRDGYSLILDEQWGEARKKFAELMRRYPRSEYRDDARFWNAYSWKFNDRKKALDEYARFMKDFPSSNYFDDAVSEYQRLGGVTRTTAREGPGGIPDAAFRIAEMEKKLAEIQERLAVRIPHAPRSPLLPGSDQPRTRLKAEALRALTRSPDDKKAFAVLKETALDTTQPAEIRMVALDGARRFRLPEVGEFLMDVVRNCRTMRFRLMAMEGLRATPAAENPSVVGFLRSLALDQRESAELRISALQVLQREDHEQFAGILSQIAKSDHQVTLQISALQYLSQRQQGEPTEAADVLREVALDRNRDPAVREIALFGLRQLSGPLASEILIRTAKTDPQERVRLAAVYSLGTAFQDDPAAVGRALEELAADRAQPRLVRQTALAQLGERGLDTDFLATLASGEPDEAIQQMAIHVLGKGVRGKEKSLSTLTSLFRSIPDDRLQSKDVLLFSVASIGNDDAVDFLASVARSNTSDPLRERAVYYLGNIGTEKARGALLEILRRP